MGATCSRGTNTLATNPSNTELDSPHKILMIGPSGAGKTQLLYAWKLGCSNVVEPMTTSDFNVEQVEAASGHSFLVFDLSGSQNFRVKRRQFYQGTEGIVFVVDCTFTKEIDDVRQDLVSLLHDRDLIETPLLVIGNKQDLPGAVSPDELETVLDLRAAIATNREWRVIGGCALKQDDVATALTNLDQLVARSDLSPKAQTT